MAYLDRLLFSAVGDFLLDLLLLWATREVMRLRGSRLRLVAGALLGTGYFLLVRAGRWHLAPGWGWASLPPVVLLVPAAMVAAAFAPLSPSRFLSTLGTFYLIALVAGGAGVATTELAGGSGLDSLSGKLVASATVLACGELGWGMVHRRVVQSLHLVDLELLFGSERWTVPGLFDTGNRLADPFTGQPVIVLEEGVFRRFCPEPVAACLEAVQPGDWARLVHLLPPEWSRRFRVIPYRTLGEENGLLVGFRADGARLAGESEFRAAVVALHPGRLDPDGAYVALVHPAFLEGERRDVAV